MDNMLVNMQDNDDKISIKSSVTDHASNKDNINNNTQTLHALLDVMEKRGTKQEN